MSYFILAGDMRYSNCFIHLHCCSEYSVSSSTIRISDLIARAKKMHMPTIALTDYFNLFAGIKFYKTATQAGIKPIFGAQINIKDHRYTYQVLLLCQNQTGYANLSELISQCYIHHQEHGKVFATKDLVKKYSTGLIMIAHALESDVAQLLLGSQFSKASEQISFWCHIFPERYYLAIERTNRLNSEEHVQRTVQIALETDTPIVATNAVQFLHKEDFYTHEVKVCINQGGLIDDERRVRHYSEHQYLKSQNEMLTLFADLPEAIENSWQIAMRCNVKFKLHQEHYLPTFPIPNKALNINVFFKQESKCGLAERIKYIATKKKGDFDASIYKKRLEFELDIICKMGFSGYFLIVSDFISWARKKKIPVGPGRGSGAGSLVAYALNITNIDPIEHGLLFERFLNPERISMPDFDIDFCGDRRDEVITYVTEKYGTQKVAQIITYGTMAAKGVVRDVGRVLGHPYGFSDTLAKLIPNELDITLNRALEVSGNLKARYESEESVRELIDIAKKLEGLVRNVGKHAGGVVIAPSKISDFCPIYKGSDPTDSIISQFDKDDLEAIGLVKFDFLGLGNLSVIDKVLKDLAQENKAEYKTLDLNNLPWDDKAVYKLLQNAQTTGIFQLESEGMRAYLKKLKPDCFADIVAMLALYRPGPLDSGMVEDYINVKHGRKKVHYPHAMLKDILQPTNGVFVYQEQVMQTAQVMAGYTLGSADLLRRAMGKKNKEEMEKQRDIFISGAIKRGVSKAKANKIFDLMNKFSGYGFNKSHSVAYALISYQTAYLKAHYPAIFMAAVLSSMMNDSDRIAFIISRVYKMNLEIIAPDINLSRYEFSAKDNTIIYGLGAIKGLGSALALEITQRRTERKYKDLVDFCVRVNKKMLNSRSLEALITCGAFDKLTNHRHQLFKTYPLAQKQAEQFQTDKIMGQNALFTMKGSNLASYDELAKDYPKWQLKEKLAHEKNVFGFYFSAHPSDDEKQNAKLLGALMPSEVHLRKNQTVCVLGLLSKLRYRDTHNGRIALFHVEDAKMKMLVALDSSKPQALTSDNMVLIRGKIDNYKGQFQIRADSVQDIKDVKMARVKNLTIMLDERHHEVFKPLRLLIEENKGDCSVHLHYYTKKARGVILLNNDYSVSASDVLSDKINHLLGTPSARIYYV